MPRTATKKPTKKIPAKWLKLFRLIPGYEPVATAAPGEWFDVDAAQRAVDFFPECLQHIEGSVAGKPFDLSPWQQAIVGCLFGWKRPDGMRRYRKAMIMVGRGNGKTPLAAGICLYCLTCDNEPGAQIYGAAAEVNQASLLFRHAKGMVEREPELAARCRIYDSFKSICLKSDSATAYKVVSSDAAGKHGYMPHLVICDELHAWQGRDLWEAFQTAFAKLGRKQPLWLVITTSDYDRESVCNDEQDYAEKVRDGIISDSRYLPALYVASKDDPWDDEATWEKANPNMDISVDREALRAECQQAKEQPTLQNAFLRYHLNIKTEQDIRWLSMDAWDASAGAPIDPGDLIGRECWAGLDLSSTRDITALSLVFPADGGYDVLPLFWVPGDSANDRERKDRVPYITWARQELLTLTDGNVVDYDKIRTRLNELKELYNIRGIAIDRWNATQLATQLAGDGFNVVAFGQGYASMSAPTKELDKLVVAGKLHHGGNPVLRWMASNVTVEQDAAGNLKPSKAKSTERIDGIVALIMALGIAMAAEVEQVSLDGSDVVMVF